MLVLGMCFFAGGTKFSEQGFLMSEFGHRFQVFGVDIP